MISPEFPENATFSLLWLTVNPVIDTVVGTGFVSSSASLDFKLIRLSAHSLVKATKLSFDLAKAIG